MEYAAITAFAQVAQVFATLVVGGGQCLLIWWGLKQMGTASDQRNRQLDAMEAAQREQSERLGTALERQGEVLAELLRRSTPA